MYLLVTKLNSSGKNLSHTDRQFLGHESISSAAKLKVACLSLPLCNKTLQFRILFLEKESCIANVSTIIPRDTGKSTQKCVGKLIGPRVNTLFEKGLINDDSGCAFIVCL